MDFELPEQLADVTFEEGHELHGLQMTLSLDTPLEFLLEAKRVNLAAADIDDAGEFFRRFGDVALVDWNLKIRGRAVEANGEGLRQLPARVIWQVFQRWMEVVTEVPAPLVEPSPSTSTSAPVPLKRTARR